MHHAQALVDGYVTRLAWARPIAGRVITVHEALSLSPCLEEDAKNYLFSAAVSLADALRGMQAGFYSWATVKLYYASFYSLRSILASSGNCIVYDVDKPRGIEAIAGTVCVKLTGVTHKVVAGFFQTKLPHHHLLTQQIGLESPVDWLTSLREEANYRRGRFWEPSTPRHLAKILRIGIRRAINAYLEDSADLYAFDPEHAMVAFPLAAMVDAASRLRTGSWNGFSDDDVAFLRGALSDKSGSLTPLVHVFARHE
jgi:uncharacterized protein (UPF0332 family)